MAQSEWVLKKVVFGDMLRLSEGVTTFGRNPTCTVVASSDYVSRNHAEINVSPGGETIEIKDLGSTNGIFVNDDRYSRSVCRLKAGDRIGFGVAVEDREVAESQNGIYPIYILRRLPIIQQNSVIQSANEPSLPQTNEHNINGSNMTECQLKEINLAKEVEDLQFIESGSEFDEDDDVDDFIPPEGIVINDDIPKPTIPPPELLDNNRKRIITENIKSIFGDLNSELLSRLPNDIVEASKETKNEDIICISSDEEENININKRIPCASPQLFNDSFTAEEEVGKVIINDPINNVQQDLPNVEGTNSSKTVNSNDNVEDSDEDDDDLYFTQKLIDDMREELPDSDCDDVNDYKVDNDGQLIITPIKQEIILNHSENETINLDDDEYDAELESKVNKWSIKLSQSFSNTSNYNLSQIYESSFNDISNNESIFISDDDDDDDKRIDKEPFESKPIITIKQEYDENQDIFDAKNIPSILPMTEKNQKHDDVIQKINDSPLIREWKRSCANKFLFSSSSSEEEDEEKVKKLNEKNFIDHQKPEINDEIPTKKPRLTSKSDENEKSSLPKHSSKSKKKKSSDKKRSDSKKKHSENDQFEKLKHTKKSSSHHRTKSEDSSNNSTSYKRSKSTTEESSGKNYLSAKIARSKSTGSASLNEELEKLDFEEEKKSMSTIVAPERVDEKIEEALADKRNDEALTTPIKTTRGPPEIINPPQLPVNKGKLRGVSAVQKRVSESFKASSYKTELKAKWLEKPSRAIQKDKQKCKAIKEDRKAKLKEIADKRSSENVCIKEVIKTKESAKVHENKPKVKITSVNRGAFLTEDTPKNDASKKNFKIPKKQSNHDKSGSTTKSTTAKPATTQDHRKLEIANLFAKALQKADQPLKTSFKQSTTATDQTKETKQRAPPRRNCNKLTFNDMDKHIEETNRLKSIQEHLASTSSTIRIKKVRFNENVQIRYIEPNLNATRKVVLKESLTFTERRTFSVSRYPRVDHVDELLSELLAWGQLWLQQKDVNQNMLVYPIPNQFSSIANYKSIVLPIMKIEYLANLEKDVKQSASRQSYKVRIDNLTNYKDRELVFARCYTPIKSTDLGVTDLALIDIFDGSNKKQLFGYIGGIRKTATCSIITIEVGAKIINKDKIKLSDKIIIRRVTEGLRVYLGSLNAVYQLEKTPLFEKILNPFELLKNYTNVRPNYAYKGFDKLNPEQTDIVLQTYGRAINDFNHSITLINGPPGTGKSKLITNLALQILYGNPTRILDKKILICAQSNMAVDVIAKQLLYVQKKLSEKTQKYNIIRFGKMDKIQKDVHEITPEYIIKKNKMTLIAPNSEQMRNAENLRNDILQLEARIAVLERDKTIDVRQDELVEMRKSLQLKKNIQNQVMSHEEEKQLSIKLLENANIVFATLSSCVKLSGYIDYFDICIIDEATQCIEPWTIMPLKFGVSCLVLVGDTQQLPATVISNKAKDLGLGTSLFTRIQKCLESNNTGDPSPVFTLCEQYRMHSEICKWPNKYFYKNMLKTNPRNDSFICLIQPFSVLNLEYKQNDNCNDGQISNSAEAEFVAKFVKALDDYISIKDFSYGIITPYSHHKDKLQSILRHSGIHNVMVNTIDSYQGIEKDVIIISNARTNGVGFLSNYQRLNVALTRPKKCLVLCGYFKNLESVPSWANLIKNAKERGVYHNISVADAADMKRNVIERIKKK